MSASSVEAWHPRVQSQKPRIESLGGKPKLSQCAGSSADCEYSFETRASSLESTEVFVETPSEMSHLMEVQPSPAALDLQNAATNSRQQYSAYIPVYQTHTDSTDALNIVRTKSMISETKMEPDSQASLSSMPSASAESCTPIRPDDANTLEISPDECVPYISFENDESLGEEHTGS